jgi:hypothetical protein
LGLLALWVRQQDIASELQVRLTTRATVYLIKQQTARSIAETLTRSSPPGPVQSTYDNLLLNVSSGP